MFFYVSCILFFFFNDTATTEIYTLSLHDALPILTASPFAEIVPTWAISALPLVGLACSDRKSTRLNSSHQIISYAVFCLKKTRRLPSVWCLPAPPSYPAVSLPHSQHDRPTTVGSL